MGVHFFFQRRIRGFDDSELWSLDYTILRFILPRLQRYREKERFGWPGPISVLGLDMDEFAFQELPEAERSALDKKSQEEWELMLGKMVRAIELQLEYHGIFLVEGEDGELHEDPELEAEHKEGWDLFIKWFHALWD